MEYSKDFKALPIPWVHSPFFPNLLKRGDYSLADADMLQKYHTDGYVIIDLNLPDSEIDKVVLDMYTAAKKDDTIYHADHFQYTESKRIFELWKDSKAAAELCMNQKVLDTLRILYKSDPFPFSTINFFKGSNQPLHSDIIHFHTRPPLWMCGVWVAFEDVDESNGTLKIIPGSHKWGEWEYGELGLPHPDTLENGEEVNYRDYEDFLVQLVKMKKVPPLHVQLKKGQALIWAANLLHGGCNVDGITDFNKTRLTQANHYFFKGCDEYYHPMFTQKDRGNYASKWCSDTNNIETYLETGKADMFGTTIYLKD
tara:strand:- start:1529 stop:2464 length:936 start_codon:yes stop_codon:yes gene_type:complete